MAKSNATTPDEGTSPSRTQVLLNSIADAHSYLIQARNVLYAVIDALPPEPGSRPAKTANCLEATVTLLDLAQQRVGAVELYVCTKEVSHAAQ